MFEGVSQEEAGYMIDRPWEWIYRLASSAAYLRKYKSFVEVVVAIAITVLLRREFEQIVVWIGVYWGELLAEAEGE